MRVTFNDRHLMTRRTGVGRYLEQILRAWPDDSGIRLRGLFSSVRPGAHWRTAIGPAPAIAAAPRLEDVAPLRLRPLSALPPPSAGQGRSWRRAAARRVHDVVGAGIARSLAPFTDVAFEPDHLPVTRSATQLTTVHDLSVIEMPGSHPAERVRAWERSFVHRLSWTTRFICVSHATASAMQRVFGVDPGRLSVIHLGPTWEAIPAGWTAALCRQRLGIPDETILHLGTIQPRKNLEVLLDAVHAAGWTDPDGPGLVLLGGLGWGDAAYWERLRSHPAADRVQWAGFADDAQVLAALVGCRGLVCPSRYEGFGLPPLEAMRLGRRAVVSTAPSLLEVVGDAAPHVDPDDVDGWRTALASLLDADPAGEAASIERATMFSWRRTARDHANVFRTAASGASAGAGTNASTVAPDSRRSSAS